MGPDATLSVNVVAERSKNHAFCFSRDTRDRSPMYRLKEAPGEIVAFRPWTRRVRASYRCPKSVHSILCL